MLKLLTLVLSILTFSSCSKNEEPPIDLRGEYCTYRNGPTGHASSAINIITDSSDNNDLIISNISGYDNTSEAFKNIPCNRIDNKLIIPELTVLIGNSDSMVISGEGLIGQDGSIRLEIETMTSSLENSFTLYLNSTDTYNYYKSYSGEGQALTVQAGQLTLKFTSDEGEELNFVIQESENDQCNLAISRQSLLEQGSNEGYLVEAEIYFGGSSAFGTVNFSLGSWQNAQSIELQVN